MSPDHDTDPNAAPPTSGNTTDPTFPPKLGKQGPKAVHVTAVQGPGVDPPPKEITTTERLLTGLLDGQKPQAKPRKKDSSGDDAAAYSASPRPVPVARNTDEEEPAVIVAPPSLRRPKDDIENGISKSTRDDATVELPRTHRRLAPFVAAAVGGLLIVLLYFVFRAPAATPPAPIPRVTTPVATTAIPPPEPIPTATPTDTLPDPVIESQRLQKAPPRISAPAPRASVSAAPAPPPSAAPGASAPPPTSAAPTSPGPAPDFDELKKGIRH